MTTTFKILALTKVFSWYILLQFIGIFDTGKSNIKTYTVMVCFTKIHFIKLQIWNIAEGIATTIGAQNLLK